MDECDDFGDRDRAYYIVTKVTIVGQFFCLKFPFFFLGGGEIHEKISIDDPKE